MISGGGDDFLLTWDWRQGQVLQHVELPADIMKQAQLSNMTASSLDGTPSRPIHNSTLKNESQKDFSSAIAVSGIWAMRQLGEWDVQSSGHVVVAFEG